MYINITDSKEADNKGSSGALVHYLEKENRTENIQEPERWFNGQRNDIEAYEVRRSLDGNRAKLGNHEAKFFLVNISPSQKELAHLMEKYGENGIKEQLKKYAEKVMDEYAKNFERPGIASNRDLMWFAKVENHRYYTYKDKEVQQGTKKRGEKKTGNQLHIQVIVSRKDITGKMKLSPMNSSKGRNTEHSKKMGQFDRMAFKQCGERVFDEQFKFERNLKDTLAYANIKKNGSLAQRKQLDVLEQGADNNYQSRSQANELAEGVANAQFQNASAMLETVGSTLSTFLEIMLEPVYDTGIAGNPSEDEDKRRKKKKKQEQSKQIRR
ncbi:MULTISPECIES: DUF5712 family protein [Sphingobacterium]|uniref:DUF5712 family protein n=1 Tax=Sphingobacterium TaxID=28453 RepID=UPI0021A64B92|nr:MULTISPECIES: DUF5712 family protein [Sphingobacterium]MCT1524876.1 DUF5712 family protein [Sphingobacterium hotanense]